MKTADLNEMRAFEAVLRLGTFRAGEGVGQQVSNASTSLRIAAAGLGLVLSPLVDCFDMFERGELVLPFGQRRVARTGYAYRLVWLRERRLTPAQRRFRDWITARAGAHREAVECWLTGADEGAE